VNEKIDGADSSNDYRESREYLCHEVRLRSRLPKECHHPGDDVGGDHYSDIRDHPIGLMPHEYCRERDGLATKVVAWYRSPPCRRDGYRTASTPPGPPPTPPVIEYRKAGIIPSQGLAELIRSGEIASLAGIEPDQIQPASIDLSLGARAYRVQASFLPGLDSTVMDRVARLDGLPPIDLSKAAVLERGAVYVIEISESLRLTNGIEGAANPKSSTGRLDVLTRLITDRATAFDRVEKGYKGPLYIEVAPLSFSVVVRQGTRLNQLRLYCGSPELSASEVARLYADGQLAKAPWGVPLPLRGDLVPVSVDLGINADTIVGYRAKKNSKKLIWT
jgi:deoxycytidine triphosphate deaminase